MRIQTNIRMLSALLAILLALVSCGTVHPAQEDENFPTGVLTAVIPLAAAAKAPEGRDHCEHSASVIRFYETGSSTVSASKQGLPDVALSPKTVWEYPSPVRERERTSPRRASPRKLIFISEKREAIPSNPSSASMATSA